MEQEVEELLKEVKVSQRSVEMAIRLYGPANITSILDRDTYVDKLSKITEKLEVFLEKACKLEDLNSCDNISKVSEDLIEKVTRNENEVKKKIECLIRNRGDPSLSKQHAGETKPNENISSLSKKIEDYCEAGPFMTHLPHFVYLIKYVVNQYQKKHPEFG